VFAELVDVGFDEDGAAGAAKLVGSCAAAAE